MLMNSVSSTEITGNNRDIANYMQEVVAIDPNNLFAEIGKPKPSRLASSVRLAVDARIPDTLPRRTEYADIPYLVGRGVADTQDFLKDAFDRHSGQLNPEDASRIIRDSSTLHVLAGLSLQAGGVEMDKTNFTSAPNRRFGINQSLTAIEADGIFVTGKTRGCPYAGKNGEIRPTPLFKEFGVWCGTLAVQSYFNHFYSIDPTDALSVES